MDVKQSDHDSSKIEKKNPNLDGDPDFNTLYRFKPVMKRFPVLLLAVPPSRYHTPTTQPPTPTNEF